MLIKYVLNIFNMYKEFQELLIIIQLGLEERECFNIVDYYPTLGAQDRQ